MASSPDDLAFRSISELAGLLRSGAVTSVALTQLFLQRLRRLGPRLAAVASLTEERGLQEARRADQELRAGRVRGPLHGIPYGAKDLFAARGAPTTWGAPPLQQQRFDEDAAVIRSLSDAGAVLVAKLSMISLAGAGGYQSAQDSLQGACRCPFALDRWSGGSSSGPAAAVVAGLVPFAIGSETLGSILSPSAFCGATGLRPTYGRVSRRGAMTFAWTMDNVGPLARSARDCRDVLAVVGADAEGPGFAPAPPGTHRPLQGQRLGVVAPHAQEADAEILAAFDVALEVLAGLGAELVPLPLPELPYRAVATLILAAEAGAALEPLITGPQLAALPGAYQREGLRAARELLAADYLHAMRLRSQMQAALSETFEQVNAWVAPTRTSAAPPLDTDLSLQRAPALAAAGNRADVIAAGCLAGLPAISVPCGFTANGLPAGLQFVADAGEEARCLELAATYQQVTRWHQVRPHLP